jgi:prepilin-type N-terminal cleavage/methylation domain-containing protein
MTAMSGLHDERGMTLVEMLVAMILMLIVLSATLTTLDSSGQNRRLVDLRTDAVETARSGMDTVVRQLRNLASPSAATPVAIDRALPTDLAFRTLDPTKKIVRYCLSDDTVPARQNILYQMIQNTASTPGSYTTCRTSTAGWDRVVQVAANVVNQRSGTAVFSYNGDTANTPTITNIRMNLIIDVNAAGVAPTQTRLASGAALRNQNQKPTANFAVTNPGAGRHFILNGTGSSDPEDRTLTYTWYAAPTLTFTPSGANQIGVGPVLDYTFPTTTTLGNYYFKLIVSDSNLTDVCPNNTTTTNCPSTGPH